MPTFQVFLFPFIYLNCCRVIVDHCAGQFDRQTVWKTFSLSKKSQRRDEGMASCYMIGKSIIVTLENGEKAHILMLFSNMSILKKM